MPNHSPVPRRIRIVGVSGSGKSHLAARVAERTGLPRLDLDEVFWDAGWAFRDIEEARAIVREFAAAHRDGWVSEGHWPSRLDGLLDPGTEGRGGRPGVRSSSRPTPTRPGVPRRTP